MFAPQMETSITFPVVPNAPRGPDRFRAGRLYGPFRDLGIAALSALQSENTSVHGNGECVLRFLAGITKFLVGDGGAEDSEEAFRLGAHVYSCDLSGDRVGGLKAAGASIEVGEGRPLSRLVVGYEVPHDRGVMRPVGAVNVSMEIDGHPEYGSAYARLSGATDANRDRQTLRAAIGYLSHDSLLVPDLSSSFGYLREVGNKLSDFQAAQP